MEESIKEPLVSIIVPVYNGERAIERCLRSIQNQSYTNTEIIVVNDGSTDHTERVLAKYAASDKRFVIINQENKGVSESRNEGGVGRVFPVCGRRRLAAEACHGGVCEDGAHL